jgi:hypothetical protein
MLFIYHNRNADKIALVEAKTSDQAMDNLIHSPEYINTANTNWYLAGSMRNQDIYGCTEVLTLP